MPIQTNIVFEIIERIPENGDLKKSLNQPLLIRLVDQLGRIAGL